jgi:hypothetical protein
MNTYQRIVLIIGAIALIVAIWTCPKFIIIEGKYFSAGSIRGTDAFAKITDIQSVLGRAIGIIGGTILVFFALKSQESKMNWGWLKTEKVVRVGLIFIAIALLLAVCVYLVVGNFSR